MARITAVHGGFLYQHLYGVACLLTVARQEDARLVVERDEDLELKLGVDSPYVQAKLRNRPLQPSDISGSLEQFSNIREEHRAGRREGVPRLIIVTNAEPGPVLRGRIASEDWPADVTISSPGAEPTDLPPAWSSVEEAFEWCVEKARRIPFGTLSPETLVWKLAALVNHAATGRSDRTFRSEELPSLLEQLLMQLQDFPDPPRRYRPQMNEPLLVTDARLRLLVGFSGAGKTAWASQAAIHCSDPVAYIDLSDMPTSSVASSIARELAARFAGGRFEGLGGALLADQTGVNVLRACARRLGEIGLRAQVILDNVHRVDGAIIRGLVEAAPELRFLCLAQPWDGQQLLEGFFGVEAEHLDGWSSDDVAAEFSEAGAPLAIHTAEHVLGLTGGLPLYVQNAAMLTARDYAGDPARFCSAIEQRTSDRSTAQEIILEKTFQSLDGVASQVAALLGLSEVPLTKGEIETVAGDLVQSPAEIARALRTLRRLSVVIGFQGDRLGLHDATRPLALDALQRFHEVEKAGALQRLTNVLIASLPTQRDVPRLSFMMRLLPRVGRTDVLVEMAGYEMFHEQGDPRSLRAELERVAEDATASSLDRFWTHDALAYWESRDGGQPNISRLEKMDDLIVQGSLGKREQMNLKFKELAYWGSERDRNKVNRVYAAANRLGPSAAVRRTLRYNYAVALERVGALSSARQVLEPLINEYFKVIGIQEPDTLGKTNRQLRDMIPSEVDQDDLKRLADTLNLWSHVVVEMGELPLLRRITAMKLYGLAQAARSLISAGTEAVDDFLTIMADPVGAREVMEQHILPVLRESQVTDMTIDIRSHYAVVLAWNNEFEEARGEVGKLADYAISDREHQMLVERSQAIEQIASGHLRLVRQAPPPRSMTKILGVSNARATKVGRNDPCPCGSGLKFKKCCAA